MRACPWLLILSLSPLLAQPRFDARDLSPRRNHVSNSSFEAPGPGIVSWKVSPAGTVSLAAEQPLHGQAAALLTAPPSQPAVLSQDVPGCAGCTYELSAWVRAAGDGGEASLAVEMLNRDMRVIAREQSPALAAAAQWQPLVVQLRAPQDTQLVRVMIVAAPGATVLADAVRLAVTAGPRRRTYGPRIENIYARHTEATWVTIHWNAPAIPVEISYRHRSWPRQRQIVSENVPGFEYSLVGLQHETEYRVSLRLEWPDFYDERGLVVEAPVQPTPPAPITVTTSAWEPRQVGLLRVWPVAPLRSLPEGGRNPQIEATREHLYVAQQTPDNITLTKLPPETLEAVWTKQLLPPAMGEPPPELLDTHVMGETLYLLLQRGPKEFALIVFNLELEQAEPPVPLPLVEAADRISHAAIATLRNQLWLLTVEETGTGPSLQAKLRLSLYSNQRLTESSLWSGPPVPYPADAALALFGDELIIPFVDLLGETLEPSYQPLYVSAFNGLGFGGVRLLRNLGRNRQPSGQQLGPNFYLVFASDANYLGYDGRYRDLMLAIVPPGRLGLEMVSYLSDIKYNVSPDIAALGSALWIVHEKLDQLPTPEMPEPTHHGIYIGRVDFGPAED